MEEETSEDQWKIVKQRSGTSIRKSLVWRVGKKIVITGIVVSSAPFVLPPLIVGSSIGFALSVPFGMVFVGYACTQKVMSMLLSGMRVQRIEEGGREVEKEEEEEEFEEDVKGRLEMRIELVEDDGKEESGCINSGSVEDDEMVDGAGVEGVVEEKRDEGIVVEEPTFASKQSIQNQQGSDVARVSEEGIGDKDESLVGRGYEEDSDVKEDDEGIVAEELGGGNNDKQEVDDQLGGNIGSGLEEVMGDMGESVTRKGKEDDYNVKDDVELRNVDEILNEEVKQDEEIVANDPVVGNNEYKVENQFDSIARGSEEGMDDMGGNMETKEDHNVKEDERVADVNELVGQEVKIDEKVVAEAPVGENNDEQEVEQLGVVVTPSPQVEMEDMNETVEGREYKENYNTIEDDKEVVEEENNDEGIAVEEPVGGIDGEQEADRNQLVEKDEITEKSGGNTNDNDKDDHKLANAKEMTALGMVVGGALGGGENEQKVENPFWHNNITRGLEEGKENVDEVIKGKEEYDVKNDEKSVDAKKRKKYQKKKDKKKKKREEETGVEEPVCGSEQEVESQHGNGIVVGSVERMESNDETKEGRGHQEEVKDDEILDVKATAEKEDEKRDAGITLEEPVGALDVEEEERPGKEVKQLVGGESTEENEKQIRDASGGVEEEPVKETNGVTEEHASRASSEKLMEEEQMKQNEHLDEPEVQKEETRGGGDVEIPEEEMVETINEETKLKGNSEGGEEKTELDFSLGESKEKDETPVEEKEVVIGGSDNMVNGVKDVKIPEEEMVEAIKEETKPVGNSLGGEGKAELDFSLGESRGKEEAPMEEREVFIERSGNKVNGGGDTERMDEKTVETAKEETVPIGDSQGVEEESELNFSLGESKGRVEAPKEEREVFIEGKAKEVTDDITTQGNENGYKENGVRGEKLVLAQMEGLNEGKKDDKAEDSKVVKEIIVVDAAVLVEKRNVGDKEIQLVEEVPIMEVREAKVIPVKDTDESEQYMSETDETTGDKDPQVHVSRAIEVDSESHHESTAVSSVTEEHGSDMGEESVDSVAPRERDQNQAADSTFEMQTEAPSEEVLHHEEKLWGLIDSMRKIVGCKSAKHSTFYEEIRALYVFTGVEPPAAFKDPVDLDEVDDRLRLLMAIVGVK